MVKRHLIILMIVLGFTGIGFTEEFTPQLCKEKVAAAAKLVEANGEASFDTLRDANGEFRFAGGKGYIWVHNLEGIMVMHPIKPSLQGKNLLNLQDSNGTYFFVAMNETVEEHGKGWIPYAWPKPGETEPSPKTSYCILVSHGGNDYVVGSGLYDVGADEIKKQFPGDVVYEE